MPSASVQAPQQIAEKRRIASQLCIELYLAAADQEDPGQLSRIAEGFDRAITELRKSQITARG